MAKSKKRPEFAAILTRIFEGHRTLPKNVLKEVLRQAGFKSRTAYNFTKWLASDDEKILVDVTGDGNFVLHATNPPIIEAALKRQNDKERAGRRADEAAKKATREEVETRPRLSEEHELLVQEIVRKLKQA